MHVEIIESRDWAVLHPILAASYITYLPYKSLVSGDCYSMLAMAVKMEAFSPFRGVNDSNDATATFIAMCFNKFTVTVTISCALWCWQHGITFYFTVRPLMVMMGYIVMESFVSFLTVLCYL